MLFRGSFFLEDEPGVPFVVEPGVPFDAMPGVLFVVEPGVPFDAMPGVPFVVELVLGVVGGVDLTDGVDGVPFAEGVPLELGPGVAAFGDGAALGDCAAAPEAGPRCPGTSVPHREANCKVASDSCAESALGLTAAIISTLESGAEREPCSSWVSFELR
jgi:hypothetical protein